MDETKELLEEGIGLLIGPHVLLLLAIMLLHVMEKPETFLDDFFLNFGTSITFCAVLSSTTCIEIG